MNTLDSALLERVILQLAVSDTVACALLNKHIHHTIRNSPRIQLKLYQVLCGYDAVKSSGYPAKSRTNGAKSRWSTSSRVARLSNPARELRDLIQGEKNLLQLRPRISSFDIPRGEIVHSIAGDQVFSIYHDTVKRRATRIDERYFELCSINRINTDKGRDHCPRKILVNFEPILQTLTVSPQDDLILVVDAENHLHSIKMWCRTEIAKEYVPGGIRLPEIEVEGGEQDANAGCEISVCQDGVVVVGCRGLWWRFDWRDGQILGRFPAEPHPHWESNAGTLISRDGLFVGLDVPRLPWVGNNAVRTAALAIFDLSSSTPPTVPDLLLELPFTTLLLSNTVRMIANIPKHIKIYPKRNTVPKLHLDPPSSQHTSIIHISSECTLSTQPPKSAVLNLVLPLSQIPALRAEHADDERWVKGRTWRRGATPFDGLTPIPFSAWVLRTHLWVDGSPPSVSADMVRTGYGSRVFEFPQRGLKERGSLLLGIRDYEHRAIQDVRTHYGALKHVEVDSPLGPNERPAKPRNQAANYTVTGHPSITHMQDVHHVQGEFKLGIPGPASRCITDGKKVIIQQISNPKAWVLDFGA
ncbi:hypothetical protein IAU59_006639 [Kwoniella sp. CBS 9459]